MRKTTPYPLIWCLCLYATVAAVMIAVIVRLNDGHFIYGLDDPYIHLSLAENLANGHYGINPGEYSSPSSSILWPVLLIPFAHTSFQVMLPLIWNLVFGMLAAGLLGLFASRWAFQRESADGLTMLLQAVFCLFLILAANLWTLTILGMEHVLQVLLAICCAYGLMKAFSGDKMPLWCMIAAAVAPSVRYENVSFTLAIVLVLFGLRLRREAVAIAVAGVTPMVLFSLFLKHLGLPLLPLSVLVKGNTFVGGTLRQKLMLNLHQIIVMTLHEQTRFSVLAMTCALSWLALSERGVKRNVLASASLVGWLQLFVGRFGWMDRYEDYAVIFLTLMLLGGLVDRMRARFAPARMIPALAVMTAALAIITYPYLKSTARSILASEATYLQQVQMHRFEDEFYKGDVAVNDLGLVSYERRPGVYVLDAYGLASLEAASQQNKSAPWLRGLVARHNIGLAMVYPEWFQIPSEWTALGRLCFIRKTLTHMGKPCVNFYATDPDAVATLMPEIRAFAKTIPEGDAFYVGVKGGWREVSPAASDALLPADVGD